MFIIKMSEICDLFESVFIRGKDNNLIEYMTTNATCFTKQGIRHARCFVCWSKSFMWWTWTQIQRLFLSTYFPSVVIIKPHYILLLLVNSSPFVHIMVIFARYANQYYRKRIIAKTMRMFWRNFIHFTTINNSRFQLKGSISAIKLKISSNDILHDLLSESKFGLKFPVNCVSKKAHYNS